MSWVEEFSDFMREYKVIGLAIALIIGLAATALVKALVDHVVMPIVTPFIPGGAWREAVWAIGPVFIGWGPFLAELIYFVIIALVVFMVAKKVLKEDKVAKK
jgi:large conductance mechanosensitive channel